MSGKSEEFSLIIVAAGSGLRMNSDVPKQYMPVCGKPLIRHALERFTDTQGLREICIVYSAIHRELLDKALEGFVCNAKVSLCTGGKTRRESVHSGLKSLSHLGADDLVLIHDVARPFVGDAEIKALLAAMVNSKAASLAVPVMDTLRIVGDAMRAGATVPRDNVWGMQTPQSFRYSVICDAHDCSDFDANYTDDTSMVSGLGIDVAIVKSGSHNFKITTQEDLYMAEKMLSTELPTRTHVGMGYDVHAFDDNAPDVHKIRLCGVDIDFDRRLKGHSDADVGLHALTDAILGAIGEGDIGMHFPPSDMSYKGMDSSVFVKRAMDLMYDKGGSLVNADITLICESPKIGLYRDQIINRVANILQMPASCVNIKATTTEKLGFTGRKEGIAANAVVSVSMPIARG